MPNPPFFPSRRPRPRVALWSGVVALALWIGVGAVPLPAFGPAWGPAVGLAADTKIGWVDAQKALDETAKGKSIRKRVEAYRDSRQQVIDTEETELKATEEKLSRQASLLSPEALRERELKLQVMVDGYRKKVLEMNRELQEKKVSLLGEFNDLLLKAVKAVAKVGNYTYVFDRGGDAGLLYADPANDLTDQVMARIDGGD